MTKKVPKKILRIERNLLVNLRRNCFWLPTPRRRRQFFWTGSAPPSENDRRAAADTMTSAHSSTKNQGRLLRTKRDCSRLRDHAPRKVDLAWRRYGKK